MSKLGRFRIKNWRIGDYIRQFSIVTAGIVVTFIGSSVIDNISTEKEIKSSMELIIDELEKNRTELLSMKMKYEKDCTMANYLLDSSFNISKFHIDTLRKYNQFCSQISSFFYSDDALEVLKSSSLMQKIEDKPLLLGIIEVYKSLDETKASLGEYYSLKSRILVDINLKNDMRHYGQVHKTWTLLLENNSMRSFCGIAGGFFNHSYFDTKLSGIDGLIVALRSRYE